MSFISTTLNKANEALHHRDSSPDSFSSYNKIRQIGKGLEYEPKLGMAITPASLTSDAVALGDSAVYIAKTYSPAAVETVVESTSWLTSVGFRFGSKIAGTGIIATGLIHPSELFGGTEGNNINTIANAVNKFNDLKENAAEKGVRTFIGSSGAGDAEISLKLAN